MRAWKEGWTALCVCSCWGGRACCVVPVCFRSCSWLAMRSRVSRLECGLGIRSAEEPPRGMRETPLVFRPRRDASPFLVVLSAVLLVHPLGSVRYLRAPADFIWRCLCSFHSRGGGASSKCSLLPSRTLSSRPVRNVACDPRPTADVHAIAKLHGAVLPANAGGRCGGTGFPHGDGMPPKAGRGRVLHPTVRA